ncbi:hypothetical protein ACFSVM_25485 [Paenibacillus shunpengii]|uniref:Uncharacterized protein n=1 Tax=Paenibacillus shunpengii TaxID=2054424 RepID=A0ABW5SW25_9BACL
MRYRKKPVVVDAFKWTGGPDQVEDPVWIVDAISSGVVAFCPKDSRGPQLLIDTLEGCMEARPGDYIIQSVNGEIYPCKADIFEQTYEAIED